MGMRLLAIAACNDGALNHPRPAPPVSREEIRGRPCEGGNGLAGILRMHRRDELPGADLRRLSSASAAARPARMRRAAGVRDAKRAARIAGWAMAEADLPAQIALPAERPVRRRHLARRRPRGRSCRRSHRDRRRRRASRVDRRPRPHRPPGVAGAARHGVSDAPAHRGRRDRAAGGARGRRGAARGTLDRRSGHAGFRPGARHRADRFAARRLRLRRCAGVPQSVGPPAGRPSAGPHRRTAHGGAPSPCARLRRRTCRGDRRPGPTPCWWHGMSRPTRSARCSPRPAGAAGPGAVRDKNELCGRRAARPGRRAP